MSVYDTREIGKVKIVMLAGGGGGGAESLTDLSDVALSSLSNGQILKYYSSDEKWRNVTLDKVTRGLTFDAPVRSISNDRITARALEEDAGATGNIMLVTTGTYSGTTSSSWTLKLEHWVPVPDVTTALVNPDGTSYVDDIKADTTLVVRIGTQSSTVLGAIGESSGGGGGGDTSQVKYQIVTKSTGGSDASITVNKYVDGTLKTSTDYLYSVLEGGVTIDGLISLEYGTIPLSYTYTLLQASTTHSAGYAYSWGYNQTVDFEDTFIVENVTHTLVGMGKAVSVSNSIITTDIEMFRAPKAGDRILMYCAETYTNPSGIIVKVNGVDTTLDSSLALGTFQGLCLLKLEQIGANLVLLVDFIDRVTEKVDNSVVGTVESGTTASQAYAVGEHFIRNGKFCTCISAIASGATLTQGTNYVEGTIADNITDIYSETETFTGKYWWDGRKIYRIVANIGYLPNSTSKDVATNIIPHEIVDIHGTAASASGGGYDGYIIAIPYQNDVSYVGVISSSTGKLTLHIVTSSDRSAFYGRMVVEYTKP